MRARSVVDGMSRCHRLFFGGLRLLLVLDEGLAARLRMVEVGDEMRLCVPVGEGGCRLRERVDRSETGGILVFRNGCSYSPALRRGLWMDLLPLCGRVLSVAAGPLGLCLERQGPRWIGPRAKMLLLKRGAWPLRRGRCP